MILPQVKRKENIEDYTLEELNDQNRGSMVESLGIKYTLANRERVEGTMPVDERTCQPFGFLSGGSSLAFAETLAGLGSLIHISTSEIAVGMQVSGNHVRAVSIGETVRGIATPLHLGRSTHVWNVDIINESTQKLISTVRVTNEILPLPEQI